MKKLLYILIFTAAVHPVFAQDEGPGEGKLREKMIEYIQTKLGLSRTEAEKFGPVFVDYFKELKRTNKDFKGDRLVLQQKTAELRLRYRDQFKPIIGEKRSNDVFTHEREFIEKVKDIRKERIEERREGRADKRKIQRLAIN